MIQEEFMKEAGKMMFGKGKDMRNFQMEMFMMEIFQKTYLTVLALIFGIQENLIMGNGGMD